MSILDHPTDRDRFFQFVSRTDDCWEWQGYRGPVDRYGRFMVKRPDGKRTPRLAHRASWELHSGPIPSGLQVLHRCDNRRCVNPEHLFLGTQLDNIRDMDAKGRRVTWLHALDATSVRQIRERYAQGGITQAQLAKEYGIAPITVSRVVRRVMYRDVA